MRMYPRSSCFAALVSSLVATSAVSQELPESISWTAYDVGSSGYGQAVAIGSALKNERGVTLRVLPGKNDVSRLVPLQQGRVDFSAFGVGAFYASEGVFEFATQEWGPQEIRLLATSNPDACNSLIVAGDIGVKTYADLRGKRVAYTKGAPSANRNAYSFLRFGNLEWSDVEQVVVGGYAASLDGIVAGSIDAANTVTTAGGATKIMASPRGGMYPPVPHNDVEGWKRLKEAGPHFVKVICREGAGITEPFEAASYPYPVLIAYASKDADTSYAMTRAMFELYPTYKDSAPGANGWALERQVLDWVLPFHEGAIRYFKEVGKWTPEYESHNDGLVARQAALKEIRAEYEQKASGSGEEFVKGWQKARAEGLEAAGLKPIFTDW